MKSTFMSRLQKLPFYVQYSLCTCNRLYAV